ncbi:glycosyltransferase family 39 protein [Streptomyces chromofuscus]|uniref:Glycosyltransferase family 39 protein n=1 Tax=Streptomyces chromofuscus TaxID=42881 RepID=A0A7M2T2I8_STRCW|nr:glycosyltransferase family 39 protein [Streptomyces chromofuscus]QOV42389.1 glycosyltransferase family 39 protein [Streptomyces chromofuscus]GGT27482.1 membrane protein [Streptomyces chromofuscus]
MSTAASSAAADPAVSDGQGIQPTPTSRRLRVPDGLRPYGAPLLLYGGAKLVGTVVFSILLMASGEYREKNPRFGGGAHWWDVLATWDGWWYLQVAEKGYEPGPLRRLAPGGMFTVEQNSVAFFPLYPGLIRGTSEVTGLGLYGSGMLVSVIASFVAAAGIYAVISLLAGARAGTVAAGLWAVAPGAGVEWAVYSESVFVAIVAWCCYCVMKGRWVAAGLLAFAAGLNRPTSAALIGAVGLAALVTLARREGRRKHGVAGPVYAMCAAPLGLLTYVAWVGLSMGEPTAYFTLQREGWLHFFDFGAYTLDVLGNTAIGKHDYVFAFSVPDLLAVQLVLALPFLIVLMLRKRPPLVLVAYTLASIVSVLGTQQIFGNTPRYLLPCFPLLLAPAAAMARLGPVALTVFFATAAPASGWYAHYVLFELGIP